MKRFTALLLVVTMVLTTTTSVFASGSDAAGRQAAPELEHVKAPQVVSTQAAMSVDELAKYGQKAEDFQAEADDESAGAMSTGTIVLIVIGVAAVAVLLAAGGGSSY